MLNQAPTAVCFFPPESGEKPLPGCLTDNPVIELSSLKEAFDGDGYTLRLFNPDSEEQTVCVTLPALEASFTAALMPLEVLSYRIRGGKAEPCALTD